MNDLKVFENKEFGQVRTSIINDEPYFNLNDVCEILEIKNTRDAKSRLNTKGSLLPTSLQMVEGNKLTLSMNQISTS